jgi:GTP cyclohydrolase II
MIKILGKQSIAGLEFTGIEGGFGEGKKSMLVREIADIHQQPFGEVNRRINDNVLRFNKGIDILDIRANGFEPLGSQLGFTKQTFNQSKNIYILSERGYAKLLKILEDDKAWELYDQFVDSYFNMREYTHQEKPKSQAEVIAMLAQYNLEQERRLNQVETRIAETEKKQENLSEIISLNTMNWQKDTTKILNKIAQKTGGYEQYRNIRNESYEILEHRAHANLGIRVTNKQKKMALEGAQKSKINKVSKIDVINDDKRLLEIYLAVVKEMAIKYQVEIEASA